MYQTAIKIGSIQIGNGGRIGTPLEKSINGWKNGNRTVPYAKVR